MSDETNYDQQPLNVKMLWNDVEFIDLQIRNLKTDVKYIMNLISRLETEIDFARKEIESCVK